jgi:hypothetical protein
MATKRRVKKTSEKEEEAVCPICVVQKCVREMAEKNAAFFEHMNNARIEFLEGIKSLIDIQIESAKKDGKGKRSRLTKIKVED